MDTEKPVDYSSLTVLSRKINFSAKVPSKDKVNAILDIENWEKVENIDKNINPIYTLELYYDTTKQDTNDDIKEITIYSNGEYVSFFTTSPGGVKQNYKTNIDITELIDK